MTTKGKPEKTATQRADELEKSTMDAHVLATKLQTLAQRMPVGRFTEDDRTEWEGRIEDVQIATKHAAKRARDNARETRAEQG